LNVNLSSSSSAVLVQNSVSVPKNATSAGFTATVFAVAATQAVTMTASAGSAITSFTVQLNAAILALSINATSVAFGDVMVDTPATQSLTMTSSGTAPVTIDEATLTGAGFTLSGGALPATLSPGQEATLQVEFDPTVVGAATGQLAITSNASTGGTMAISLGGTGTAAQGVAVVITPSNASTTIGAAQQFVASVTGTSNTAVTWTASGTGCSGATCGTISSSGLYTSPAAVPSSAAVTITATSQADPTKSATANVSIVPPQAAGYSLVWEDTFSALSLCTTNVPGCNWYNPGIPIYSGDGVITDPSGTYVNLDWTADQGSSFTNMSTASMNFEYSRAWTFGYFEVSMAFDPDTGNWPALWLRPVNQTNGNGAEIDIFEWQSSVGGTSTTTNYAGTIHSWNQSVDTPAHTYELLPNAVWSNYNTYGVLWTKGQVCWYFNNALVGNCVSTASAPFNTQFAGEEAMFLILSEQAGCNWAYSTTKPCAGQVSPLDMKVQWVHVYSPPAS
jgi:beta-glucanase (GH16 family)